MARKIKFMVDLLEVNCKDKTEWSEILNLW